MFYILFALPFIAAIIIGFVGNSQFSTFVQTVVGIPVAAMDLGDGALTLVNGSVYTLTLSARTVVFDAYNLVEQLYGSQTFLNNTVFGALDAVAGLSALINPVVGEVNKLFSLAQNLPSGTVISQQLLRYDNTRSGLQGSLLGNLDAQLLSLNATVFALPNLASLATGVSGLVGAVGRLSSVPPLLDTVDSMLSIKAKVSPVLTGLSSNLSSLSDSVSALTGPVGMLVGNVTSLNSTLAPMPGRMSTVGAGLSQLLGAQATMPSIADLNQDLQHLEDRDDGQIDNIIARLDALKSAVETINSGNSSCTPQVSLNTTIDTVALLKTDVDTLGPLLTNTGDDVASINHTLNTMVDLHRVALWVGYLDTNLTALKALDLNKTADNITALDQVRRDVQGNFSVVLPLVGDVAAALNLMPNMTYVGVLVDQLLGIVDGAPNVTMLLGILDRLNASLAFIPNVTVVRQFIRNVNSTADVLLGSVNNVIQIVRNFNNSIIALPSVLGCVFDLIGRLPALKNSLNISMITGYLDMAESMLGSFDFSMLGDVRGYASQVQDYMAQMSNFSSYRAYLTEAASALDSFNMTDVYVQLVGVNASIFSIPDLSSAAQSVRDMEAVLRSLPDLSTVKTEIETFASDAVLPPEAGQIATMGSSLPSSSDLQSAGSDLASLRDSLINVPSDLAQLESNVLAYKGACLWSGTQRTCSPPFGVVVLPSMSAPASASSSKAEIDAAKTSIEGIIPLDSTIGTLTVLSASLTGQVGSVGTYASLLSGLPLSDIPDLNTGDVRALIASASSMPVPPDFSSLVTDLQKNSSDVKPMLSLAHSMIGTVEGVVSSLPDLSSFGSSVSELDTVKGMILMYQGTIGMVLSYVPMIENFTDNLPTGLISGFLGMFYGSLDSFEGMACTELDTVGSMVSDYAHSGEHYMTTYYDQYVATATASAAQYDMYRLWGFVGIFCLPLLGLLFGIIGMSCWRRSCLMCCSACCLIFLGIFMALFGLIFQVVAMPMHEVCGYLYAPSTMDTVFGTVLPMVENMVPSMASFQWNSSSVAMLASYGLVASVKLVDLKVTVNASLPALVPFVNLTWPAGVPRTYYLSIDLPAAVRGYLNCTGLDPIDVVMDLVNLVFDVIHGVSDNDFAYLNTAIANITDEVPALLGALGPMFGNFSLNINVSAMLEQYGGMVQPYLSYLGFPNGTTVADVLDSLGLGPLVSVTSLGQLLQGIRLQGGLTGILGEVIGLLDGVDTLVANATDLLRCPTLNSFVFGAINSVCVTLMNSLAMFWLVFWCVAMLTCPVVCCTAYGRALWPPMEHEGEEAEEGEGHGSGASSHRAPQRRRGEPLEKELENLQLPPSPLPQAAPVFPVPAPYDPSAAAAAAAAAHYASYYGAIPPPGAIPRPGAPPSPVPPPGVLPPGPYGGSMPLPYAPPASYGAYAFPPPPQTYMGAPQPQSPA